MPYKPPSIREQGLPIYLEKTRDDHNGLGWKDFKQRMDLRVPKPKIADDFGMSKQRIWAWVEIYNEIASKDDIIQL